MHVAAPRTRHQREDVETALGEPDRLGVGIRGLQHQGVEAFAPLVEEPLEGLAQGLAGVGGRHELDVAAAVGDAHGDVGAQRRHRAVREVDDGHAEGVPERRHGMVEVVHGDGDAGHGGDHGALLVVVPASLRRPSWPTVRRGTKSRASSTSTAASRGRSTPASSAARAARSNRARNVGASP